MSLRRRSRGRLVVLAAAFAVTAAGCGSDGGGSVDVLRSEEGDLGAAFAETAEAATSAYRVSSAQGQVIRSSALGIDTVAELDPSRPTTVVEVAATGERHIVLDLGPVFAPLAASDAAVAAAVDKAGLEMWVTADEIVIDATKYQVIADLNPNFDLGPFAPGIGVIDLGQVEDFGGEQLVEVLVGSGTIDPQQVAERLPGALSDVVQSASDPNTYTGTASFSSMLEALGGDLDNVARTAAAGLAEGLGLDAGEVTEFYVAFFGGIVSDVTVVVGADGSVESIRQSTDLSSLYGQLFSDDSAIATEMSDAERAEARAAFADTVWTMDSLATFEFDDSIRVEPPTGEFEDRTAAAIVMFESVAD